MITENITPRITNTDIISSKVKPLWLLRSVFFRSIIFSIPAFGYLLLAVGFGVHFDPSFLNIPAFIALSSLGIIERIVELPSLNPQPTTAIVNSASRVFTSQGTFFPHPHIVYHFMEIRQLEPPVMRTNSFFLFDYFAAGDRMSKMKSPASFIKCELAKIVQSLKIFIYFNIRGLFGCLYVVKPFI